MSKKTKIDDQEKATFRDAMRGIKRIKDTKVTLAAPVKKVTPRKAELLDEPEYEYFSDYETLPSVGSDDILQFSRPGIQHKILRNLRNGKYNIEATLDLHGMTVVEAQESLSQFLYRCQQRGVRHVLIIHGKGRTTHKPILKNKINHWLRQTEQVLAFSSATLKDGRGGSLYVLLKDNGRL